MGAVLYQGVYLCVIQAHAVGQEAVSDLLAGDADHVQDVLADGLIVAGHRAQDAPAAVGSVPEF